MAQFSLYHNRNRSTRKAYPYFVDVQNALVDTLNTRLVIPLARHNEIGDSVVTRLCPLVSIGDETFVLLTQQMTTIPLSALSMEVGSLEQRRDDIIAAIDFLVTGI